MIGAIHPRRRSPFRFVLQRRTVVAVPVIGAAAVAGWASTGKTLRYINADASIVILALVALIGLALLSLRAPLAAYAALFLSFPLGDLVRKLGTGDPRLIFGRDILLVIATVALSLKASPWFEIRRACRSWLVPLSLFVAWFGLSSVNAALFHDFRIPLVGARLYFEYLPLLGVGWYLSQDEQRFGKAVGFGAVILCVGTLIGVVQALVGPSFLGAKTATATEYFQHLDLQRRTLGQTASTVFQPTGLFVETGRYADWVFVNLAVGLALIPRRSLGPRRFLVAIVGALGMFAYSGRTLVVAGVLLIVAVVFRQLQIDSKRAVSLVLVVFVLVATFAIVIKILVPSQFEARVQFVGHSLNFASSNAEVSSRAPSYLGGPFQGVWQGKLIGRGAGTQGLGRQYLGGVATDLSSTEGGLASVAVESGLIGLLLWIFWTWACCKATFRAARRAPDDMSESLVVIAIALTVQMSVSMLIGIGAIQDFVSNAWFFLAVGLVAGFGAKRVFDEADMPGTVDQPA